MRSLTRYVDPARSRSLGNFARRRRFERFLALIAPIPRPLRLIDIGGRTSFWEQMGFADAEHFEFTIVNPEAQTSSRPNFRCLTGDARSLEFDDGAFDIAFSNSVIEHVGTYGDQAAMAAEVTRVATAYFVQTPNRWFPIEPHFLVPGFQFLPTGARAALLQRKGLGYVDRIPDRRAALEMVESIRLLTASECARLFPGAKIYRERVAGLTKSFVAYGGWETLADTRARESD